MASYLVAYDLIKAGEHDYQELWDELERLKARRTQDSLWLVPSPQGAKALHDTLKGYMHADDRLWVAELTSRYSFSAAMGGTNKWIENNPPRTCS